MIRRLVTLIGIFSLSFFAACGGGDDPTPPNPGNKFPQADINGLKNGAENMVQKCTQGLGSSSLLLATGLMSSGGAGNIAALLPMLSGAGGDCENSLMNFWLLATTMKDAGGNSFANDPQGKRYMVSQAARVADRLWAGIVLDFQTRGIPLTQAQALGLQQQLIGSGPLILGNLIGKSGSNAGTLGSIAAGLGY